MKMVDGYINRKSLLNKTAALSGRYAINHVQGCAHGCQYPCYAYLMAKRFGKVSNYRQWQQVYLTKNIFELLDNEIIKLQGKLGRIHLCFATDPFMYEYEEIANTSLQIIRKLNFHSLPCSILTKGLLPAQLASLSPENQYGISLISLDEKFRQKYEPGAAPYTQRIEALYKLHLQGCYTYVNIEPYPTPNILEQNLSNLLGYVAFVDEIAFGKLNYNPIVNQYSEHELFYTQVRKQLVEFCQTNKILCYIHG